jgi:glycosyltransferase involved in cell wall biosynthesis
VICHLTSVHSRYDTRIFLKECRTLASANYSTHLVVADGKGDETRDGVRIIDAGASRGRLDRMRHAPSRVLKKALAVNAKIYHLHDPELIPIGLALKKSGKKVVFDAHEDVPTQLLGKPYLNKPLRWVLSKIFSHYESWACRQLDGIVAATPFICRKFEKINRNSVNVGNYPLLGELSLGSGDNSTKQRKVAYVGGVSLIRGIRELVHAMMLAQSDVRLQFAGKFSEMELERLVKAEKGWNRVDELGFLDRNGVRTVLSESIAGMVTFHPTAAHLDALPIKMFEYMSAGIPVIASNFPLWQEIIDDSKCGVCVDPLDPVAIARAIDYLASNFEEAEQMGRSGQKAVQERYNWNIETKKLLEFYRNLSK